MKFYYSDIFNIPLPDGHRFPGDKYTQLRNKLLVDDILSADDLIVSPFASRKEVLSAHCPDYVDRFENGKLTEKEIKRIGFPWSKFLVKRTLATTGGAIAAAKSAIKEGISGQLAGGTHHAHRDFGAGYCIYNDQAVTALSLIEEKIVNKVLIIDLDVHQGDGTAAILKDHPDVFVFSMHGEKNFPFRKFESDLDIGLPDETSDDHFLHILENHLENLFSFNPDLVLYQAGVDALEQDRLGRLSLSHDGLKKRDQLVLEICFNKEIPISMAIGGGYSQPITPTLEAYANTYRVAKDIYGF